MQGICPLVVGSCNASVAAGAPSSKRNATDAPLFLDSPAALELLKALRVASSGVRLLNADVKRSRTSFATGSILRSVKVIF
jgi:hypothetical protein